MTMNNLVQTVKAAGSIGVVGVFIPKDPGGADELAKEGKLAFDFGNFWIKGQPRDIQVTEFEASIDKGKGWISKCLSKKYLNQRTHL